jgi:hypothetical protein
VRLRRVACLVCHLDVSYYQVPLPIIVLYLVHAFPLVRETPSSLLARRQFSYALDLDERTHRQRRHTDARPRRQRRRVGKVLEHTTFTHVRSDQKHGPYRRINLVEDDKVALQVRQVDVHFDDVLQVRTGGVEARRHDIEGSYLEMTWDRVRSRARGGWTYGLLLHAADDEAFFVTSDAPRDIYISVGDDRLGCGTGGSDRRTREIGGRTEDGVR